MTPVRADLDTGARQRVAVCTSRGLRAVRHLARFINVDQVLAPHEVDPGSMEVECVLVWGRKPSSVQGLRHASCHGLPVLYLEDGWLRSSARSSHNALTYSLLVDRTGVYYDASTPSDLENLLNLDDAAFAQRCPLQAIEYARRCRQSLVAQEITKYNFCRQAQTATTDRSLVLVIDQTLDDASVLCGGMDGGRFEQMLHSAIEENPGARVVLRTHPDVASGRRKGYLGALARQLGVETSAPGDNPMTWLRRAERVYVGTSQIGYEALLCERPVIVFGQPFYAGWGLTEDRQPVNRRVRCRSIDQLFHAAHVELARYRHPVTGAPWALHECLEHIALQKRTFAQNAEHFQCAGMTPWKRRYLAQYLRSPDGRVEFATLKSRWQPGKTPLVWGYSDQRTAPAAQSVTQPWRVEDGFLRSTGLGSDYTAPGSLVVDRSGLYLDPESPSDLEQLLNEYDCSDDERRRAHQLRERIVNHGLSKYNNGNSPAGDTLAAQLAARPADKSVVLVVGQVEDDMSIQLGCQDVRTNADLLVAVRRARPDAWVVYRPHPDVLAGNRRGQVERAVLTGHADELDAAGSSTGSALQACHELHTMTSLTGFEALLQGKSVSTYGSPFYAGWGLTCDRHPMPRRVRRRTLDELVYLALIEYPRYLHIETGEFLSAEDMVETMLHSRESKPQEPANWVTRQIRKAGNLARGLSYAP